MFFKNLTPYTLNNADQLDELAEDALARHEFVPCTSLQTVSSGWAPVQGVFVYKYLNHVLLNFVTERKVIPGSAVKSLLAERVLELEAEQGYKVGRRALREIKETVRDELCARALASRKVTAVWVDTAGGRLLIDSTSNTVIESILRELRVGAGVETEPYALLPNRSDLTKWLKEGTDHLEIGDTAQVQLDDDEGAIVTYKQASQVDMRGRLEHLATVLAISVNTDDVSFTLDGTRLTKIRPIGQIKEACPDADRFQQDFAAMTTLLSATLNHLAEIIA